MGKSSPTAFSNEFMSVCKANHVPTLDISPEDLAQDFMAPALVSAVLAMAGEQ
jgi:hypothetical protein